MFAYQPSVNRTRFILLFSFDSFKDIVDNAN